MFKGDPAMKSSRKVKLALLNIVLRSNSATEVGSSSWPLTDPTVVLVAWSVEPVELCTK